MKVHQFACGIWDHQAEPTALALCCKRLRPLAPKLPCNNNNETTISELDLKSFIRPETCPGSVDAEKSDPSSHPQPPQVETHPGGTRWNPTQEQIGILEMLYRDGVRTPNAQQIEQITAQLGKYGKIEGKNVFYWFQNHKARERQKKKRTCLGLGHFPRTSAPPSISLSGASLDGGEENNVNIEEHSPSKRKYRSWGFEFSEFVGREDRRSNNSSCREEDEEEEEGHSDSRTLVLFPLLPEGR